MATTTPMHESGSGIVSAAGRASVTLQPLQAFERWHVTRMTVSTSGTTLVPTAKVYRNAEAPTNLIDGSHTGTLDHSDTNIVLQTGEALVCVFEGATPGARSTFTIEGEKVYR
jgi:hypothetical protein